MKPLYTGIGLKNISKKNIENIKIPLPTLIEQNNIILNIDELNLKNKKLNNEIQENIIKSKNIINNNIFVL